MPYAQVAPALARGALVQVLEGVLESESRMAVVYVEREFLQPAVRAFVDAVVAWAKREGANGLWPQPVLDDIEGRASPRKKGRSKARKR